MQYQPNNDPLKIPVTAAPPTAPTTEAIFDTATVSPVRRSVRYVTQPMITPPTGSTYQCGAAFDVGADEHRQVTEKFIAAAAGGDLDGLLEVLAPDAWGDFDAGPGRPQVPGVIRGALRVARNVLRYWGPETTLVTNPVAGQPALLGFRDRRLAGILVFSMRGGKIQSVHVIGDPRQLSFVSSQLG